MVLRLSAFVGVGVSLCAWALTPSGISATYYVAPTGSDTDAGTYANPWATVNKGTATLCPGDTLYIRGGTYYQSVYVPASGTLTSPITVAGYPGEEAIIDGQYALPVNPWTALFAVEGSNAIVRNLTVKCSNWVGVVLKGQNDQALGIKSQLNMENGILVTGGADYSLVENCEVYYNAKSNEGFQELRGAWATGLSCARGPEFVVLRNNRIWNNWGEGLSVYETQHATLEGNTVYDNQMNVYLSDTKFTTVQANLIYSTTNNPCFSTSQLGIGIGDEQYNPPSSDNTIVNNLLFGNSKNIYYWPMNPGDGLVNFVIAYNTCVGSVVESNLKIGSATHTNSILKNNIFVQDDALPIAVIAGNQGLEFSHNLWSKLPPPAGRGVGDRTGNPALPLPGGVASVLPGQLLPQWFRVPGSSLAAGAAETMPGVPIDYFGNPRGSYPDLGAVQHLPPAPKNLRLVQTQNAN